MHVVIIGGGVAGVSCAEELARLASAKRTPSKIEVTIVSASRSLVGVRSLVQVSTCVERLQVERRPIDFLSRDFPGVVAIEGVVSSIDVPNRLINLVGRAALQFDRVILCTGARPMVPKVLSLQSALVHTIRDSDSVE